MKFDEKLGKFVTYANHEAILEIKTASERLDHEPGEGNMLAKFAKTTSEPEVEDGYVYVRTRAISSRVNKNNDGWPSEELAKSYQSFIGRPVFVDHNNSDPRRTRGVIVDAKLHVDDDKTSALDPYYSSAPDNHKPPTWVELLIEVDGKTFPKLATAIKNGDVDATSMGANIEKSVCSVCANEATVPSEYCNHIKSKGATFEVTADNGEKVQKKAYEDCYGVNFFEDSFVFDPADETALNIGVDEKMTALASTKEAWNPFKKDDPPAPGLWDTHEGLPAGMTNIPPIYQTPQDYAGAGTTLPYANQWDGETTMRYSYHPNLGLKVWPAQAGYHKDWMAEHGVPPTTEGDTSYAGGILTPAEIQEYHAADPELKARGVNAVRDWLTAQGHPAEQEVKMHYGAIKEAFDASLPHIYDWQKLTFGLIGLGLAAARVRQMVEALREGASPDDVASVVPGARDVILDAAQEPVEPQKQPYDQQQDQGRFAHLISKIAELQDIEDRELNYEPQSDMVTAPEKVDTLHDDIKCPNCKVDTLDADPDGILRCPTCAYEQPPEGLDNPDLGVAKDIDKDKALEGDTSEDDVIRAGDEDADDSEFIKPLTRDTNKASATNSNVPTGVISEMKWETKIATDSASEANRALDTLGRVTSATLKTNIEYPGGVHFPTHAAFTQHGLSATVTYPDGTTLAIPDPNPVAHMMKSAQFTNELGLNNPGEIPVTVEAPDHQMDAVLHLLHSGGDASKLKEATVEKTSATITVPYPGGQGIHNGTSAAFQQSGITAVVTIPGAPMPLHLPFQNANAGVMMAMFKMQGLVGEGKPIQVESENPEAAAYLIENNANVEPGQFNTWPPQGATAAVTKSPGKKQVALPHDTNNSTTDRVVSDQKQPVTADRRVIKREESPDGHRTEQIVEETGDLLGEDQEPKNEKKDEEKVDTNQPRSQKEREENDDDGKPNFLKNREKQPVAASVDPQEKFLAALSVAEEAVSMNIISAEKKLAFVGQLEDETMEEIDARRKTLALVKSAGLTNRKSVTARKAPQLPKLAYASDVTQSNGIDLDNVPFEAIFI